MHSFYVTSENLLVFQNNILLHFHRLSFWHFVMLHAIVKYIKYLLIDTNLCYLLCNGNL